MKLFLPRFMVFVVICKSCYCRIQCLDEEGDPVDWLVLYKLPRISDHSDINVKNGTGYFFLTSRTISRGWNLSTVSVSADNSIPGRLFAPLTDANENEISDTFYLFYNDQAPDKRGSVAGHTKGAVVGDADGGFWLVHSVPHFPSIKGGKYIYPTTGHTYGQSFLCISVNQTDLDSVGQQLIYNDANVFDSEMDSSLRDLYPTLYKAISGESVKDTMHKEMISSVGGQHFLSFAKSAKFKKDLYSEWVADVLESGLFVESWIHQEKMPSECNETYYVQNVREVSITNSVTFSSFKDHSKWAVSSNYSNPWVCVGDINRADDQINRGGGTVCFENSELWTSYYNTIASTEFCPTLF